MFSYCMLLAICPFVCLWTFLRFWLLFKNHLTYFNQTELKASLVKENSVFFQMKGHTLFQGEINIWYWMVWRSIWNLFHKWDEIFDICRIEINSIFNVQLLDILCFFQFLDTACNTCQTWHHKSLYLSHCENNTFDIFTVWK